MHKINVKRAIPDVLISFCKENPNCRDWNYFYHNYQESYKKLKRQIFVEQNFLCAYCEERIKEKEFSHQRIEHFHPKEDIFGFHNWAFDWYNMFGVCMGGTKDQPSVLHCDAKKEQEISYDACEGYLLNPLDMPDVCLFTINRISGELQVNEEVCKVVRVECNKFLTVVELVENTIRVLNLNCDKLNKKRLAVIHEFERMRKSLRQNSSIKYSVREEIAKRWFESGPPSFFTTRRILLGGYAENFFVAAKK